MSWVTPADIDNDYVVIAYIANRYLVETQWGPSSSASSAWSNARKDGYVAAGYWGRDVARNDEIWSRVAAAQS